MQGKLLTQDFLREGIQETDAWKRLDAGRSGSIPRPDRGDLRRISRR